MDRLARFQQFNCRLTPKAHKMSTQKPSAKLPKGYDMNPLAIHSKTRRGDYYKTTQGKYLPLPKWYWGDMITASWQPIHRKFKAPSATKRAKAPTAAKSATVPVVAKSATTAAKKAPAVTPAQPIKAVRMFRYDNIWNKRTEVFTEREIDYKPAGSHSRKILGKPVAVLDVTDEAALIEQITNRINEFETWCDSGGETGRHDLSKAILLSLGVIAKRKSK